MACGFNLRTGRNDADEQAPAGGTWYYTSAVAVTVLIDSVSTTLNQNDQVGTTDDPLIEFSESHCGNIYDFQYVLTDYCDIDNYTINTSIEVVCGSGCTDLADGTPYTMCNEGGLQNLIDYIDWSACGATPPPITWTVIEGDPAGVDTVNGTINFTYYNGSDQTVVVQGQTGSGSSTTSNTTCVCGGGSAANATFIFLPLPAIPVPATIPICN